MERYSQDVDEVRSDELVNKMCLFKHHAHELFRNLNHVFITVTMAPNLM